MYFMVITLFILSIISSLFSFCVGYKEGFYNGKNNIEKTWVQEFLHPCYKNKK